MLSYRSCYAQFALRHSALYELLLPSETTFEWTEVISAEPEPSCDDYIARHEMKPPLSAPVPEYQRMPFKQGFELRRRA